MVVRDPQTIWLSRCRFTICSSCSKRSTGGGPCNGCICLLLAHLVSRAVTQSAPCPAFVLLRAPLPLVRSCHIGKGVTRPLEQAGGCFFTAPLLPVALLS